MQAERRIGTVVGEGGEREEGEAERVLDKPSLDDVNTLDKGGIGEEDNVASDGSHKEPVNGGQRHCVEGAEGGRKLGEEGEEDGGRESH